MSNSQARASQGRVSGFKRVTEDAFYFFIFFFFFEDAFKKKLGGG